MSVNPAELTVKHDGNNTRTEVVKLGEISILRDTKLAAVSLELLFPGDDYYPFITGRWRPPDQLVQYFRRAMESKAPLRFVVSEFGLSMRVSVESVTSQRAAGDHDSVKCLLSLLQYRPYRAAGIIIIPSSQTPKAVTSSRPDDKPQSKSHTVKSGESFWAIAQRELGDGSRYSEIAQLNGMNASSVIHPGDVLKLPDK